jgi:hypothetical protein
VANGEGKEGVFSLREAGMNTIEKTSRTKAAAATPSQRLWLRRDASLLSSRERISSMRFPG